MKKLSLVYLLCCSLFIANGQHSNDIVIGKIDSINSKILNEERKIWVHVPEDNSEELYGKKKSYPVIYLLDGDAHFDSVVGMVRQLSSVNGNGICPKMIVIGIPNTNRTRDLTPSKGKPRPGENKSWFANSGGGENFMAFIQKELIPYVNSKYPTQSYKMLIGHSLGGLTVINTLVHQPNLFDAYVAIDPSMWWNDKKLLKEIKHINFDKKYNNKSLYLGIANTMNPGMDIKKVQKDTSSQTEHIRSILELNTFLNKETQKELSYKGKYYENDDHGSVPLITEYDAFRFIFDFYRLKLEHQDFMDTKSNLLDKVVNHYKRLSKEFKTEMKPDEEYINDLGYRLMGKQQLKKAEQFLKLNLVNYPGSWNAYDSYGEILLKLNKKEKSIEMYKKSIALNPNNEDAKKIIKMIRNDL